LGRTRISSQSDSSDPYVAAGVDYRLLDEGKRLALSLAISTSDALPTRGAEAIERSRGEPAFMFRLGDRTFAFVLEGLGTKSMIARAYRAAGGEIRYDDIAYDTVAAILNDLACVGALPLVLNAYFATGDSEWYEDEARSSALVEGWQRACRDAGCAWGGGESPSLTGLVASGEIELAGSAVGVIPVDSGPFSAEDLDVGQELVMLGSSGLHANGASLARRIASELPEAYQAPLVSGRTFGAALLDPSLLYVRFVEAIHQQRLPVRYLSHISGHGLLKLMRPPAQYTYRVTALPPVPEVLQFMVDVSRMGPAAAYRTLNMGVGYVAYCDSGFGREVAEAARDLGYTAIVAGLVEAGPRRVILEPVSVEYASAELNLGP
jgi:phosphoribosylformylglycinamidine cyclo-ligase